MMWVLVSASSRAPADQVFIPSNSDVASAVGKVVAGDWLSMLEEMELSAGADLDALLRGTDTVFSPAADSNVPSIEKRFWSSRNHITHFLSSDLLCLL